MKSLIQYFLFLIVSLTASSIAWPSPPQTKPTVHAATVPAHADTETMRCIHQLKSSQRSTTWGLLLQAKTKDAAKYMPWTRYDPHSGVVQSCVLAWLQFFTSEALATPQTETQLALAHHRLQILAHRFMREGSITSLVLRDTIIRLLVLDDLRFASAHPARAKLLLKDKRFRIPIAFTRKAIKRAIPTTVTSKMRKALLDALHADDTHLYTAISKADGLRDDPWGQSSSSYLSAQQDVAKLARRMILTVLIRNVRLPSTLGYFGAGGTIRELKEGNVYKILPRLRVSGFVPLCPLLGIDKIGPQYVADSSWLSGKGIPPAFRDSFE